MRLIPAVLLLASCVGWAAAAPQSKTKPGAIEGEIQRLSAQGFEVRQKASSLLANGTRLTAMVLGRSDGGGFRLIVYAAKKKALIIYYEPSLAGLRLASVHEGGELPDMAGDGSRILAYVVEFSGIQQSSLVLMRYANGKLARVGRPLQFAEFEDISMDGSPEIVSRERPLGGFFSLDCDAFFTMAQAAQRTRIHAFENGRLETVSSKFPAFYRAHMSNLEVELANNDPVKTGRYGDYLGAALSLYFDYEETGRRKEGWERFKQAFKTPSGAPAKARNCMQEMGLTLRRKLNIPPDWD
ncbi:MAG: hypothetical protein HY922_04140 [Elusimicrobia bacterium]|nr:hypothetical protein [Elusimicrobiota bacterium]